MRFTTAVTAFAAASVVAAERFTIIVGGNNGLTFDPPSQRAVAGDVIAFQFQSKNHTATQSTFDQPCTPKAGGIDSGYLPVAPTATSFQEWSFTIIDAAQPMWFYCAQGAHCRGGMVFALNPTAERTLEQFRTNAAGGGAPAANTTAPGSGALGLSTPKAFVLAAAGLAAGFLL